MNKAYLAFILCIVSLICVFSPAFVAGIPDGGYAFYNFSEENDYWNTNDATSNGATNENIYPTFGVSGDAGPNSFDFTNDNVESNITLGGLQNFTLSFWMYPEATGDMIMAQQSAAAAGSQIWYAYFTGGSVIELQIHTSTGRQDTTGTTTLSTNNWHHVVIRKNETNTSIWINGTHDKTGSGSGTMNNDALTWYFGKREGPTTLDYDGNLDYVKVFQSAITAAEITTLYDYGELATLNDTAYYEITARDHYDSSAITTFNVTLSNGSFYNTTNGTVKTNINQSIDELINFTIEVTDYFNRSYTNINTSTDTATELWQAIAYFTASQKISGAAVSTFNATISAKTNDSSPPMIRLKAGNYTATASATGYFNPSEQIDVNVSPYDNLTFNFTGLYNHLLKVNVSVLAGSATEDNLTVDVYCLNYTFHEQHNTTNGTVSFNLTEGLTYQVYLNDSIHALDHVNVTLNTSNSITNVTFEVYTTNSFKFTFKNESDDTIINTSTVYFSLISGVFSQNYTTSNGSHFLELLVPAHYTIRYYTDEDVPRDYYITLTNQSFNNLSLYIIKENVSGFFLPSIKDESGYSCINQTVSLLRHYIDDNAYRVVEMARTDTSGQAVLRVRPNIIDYKLLISGSCGTFTTQPQKFVAQTQSYTVADSQSPLTSVVGIGDVISSLTFNNVTNTFVYTWSDTTNLVTHGCLKIDKYKFGVMSQEYDNCTAGAIGSIIHTINDTNGTKYVSSSSLMTNSEYSTWPDKVKNVDFVEAFKNFGKLGLLLTLFVLLGFSFMALGSTERAVVAGVFAIVIMSAFGFIFNSWVTLIGIIIVMVIIMYKSRT